MSVPIEDNCCQCDATVEYFGGITSYAGLGPFVPSGTLYDNVATSGIPSFNYMGYFPVYLEYVNTLERPLGNVVALRRYRINRWSAATELLEDYGSWTISPGEYPQYNRLVTQTEWLQGEVSGERVGIRSVLSGPIEMAELVADCNSLITIARAGPSGGVTEVRDDFTGVWRNARVRTAYRTTTGTAAVENVWNGTNMQGMLIAASMGVQQSAVVSNYFGVLIGVVQKMVIDLNMNPLPRGILIDGEVYAVKGYGITRCSQHGTLPATIETNFHYGRLPGESPAATSRYFNSFRGFAINASCPYTYPWP